MDGAEVAANDADYLFTEDGKHWCRNCTEWDEEGDERIPKKDKP